MSSTKSISSAAAALGSVSSPAKTAAARENGKLGGRPSPFRRVTHQSDTDGDYVYRVPATGDWANWRDADAVAYHGELVGLRYRGQWVDRTGQPLDSELARQCSRLQSIGITTRQPPELG